MKLVLSLVVFSLMCCVSPAFANSGQNHQFPPAVQSVRLTFSVNDATPLYAFQELRSAIIRSYPSVNLKVAYSDMLTEMLIKYALHKDKIEQTFIFRNEPIDKVVRTICAGYNITWSMTGDTLILYPLVEE